MTYFSINELTRSATAAARGIDNTPPAAALTALTSLVNECLDVIREEWGAPLYVNSGYRSAELNRAVGGVAGSQHLKGEAADITAGTLNKNRTLYMKIKRLVQKGAVEIDQCILENGGQWLHISYRHGKNRLQFFRK